MEVSMEFLKALFSSKKAGAFLLGVIVLLLTSFFDVDEETAKQIAAVIVAYLLGQGLADMRK
jgi:hypothetical protein